MKWDICHCGELDLTEIYFKTQIDRRTYIQHSVQICVILEVQDIDYKIRDARNCDL